MYSRSNPYVANLTIDGGYEHVYKIVANLSVVREFQFSKSLTHYKYFVLWHNSHTVRGFGPLSVWRLEETHLPNWVLEVVASAPFGWVTRGWWRICWQFDVQNQLRCQDARVVGMPTPCPGWRGNRVGSAVQVLVLGSRSVCGLYLCIIGLLNPGLWISAPPKTVRAARHWHKGYDYYNVGRFTWSASYSK